MSADLAILGRISSINVRKVTWTCAEIGLAVPREEWGAGHASTKAPEFLALNPNGLVPVLKRGDGEALWESNTICRYLAGAHGRADLLPIEPWARAQVEKWMDWQATELNSAWRYAFLSLVRKSPGFTDAAQVAASAQAWNGLMGLLERHLAAGGPFATGETFTLADINLGLAVHRWSLTPIERPDCPAIAAYYERLKARPAFQAHGSIGEP